MDSKQQEKGFRFKVENKNKKIKIFIKMGKKKKRFS